VLPQPNSPPEDVFTRDVKPRGPKKEETQPEGRINNKQQKSLKYKKLFQQTIDLFGY
jgi:hypothetical protein